MNPNPLAVVCLNQPDPVRLQRVRAQLLRHRLERLAREKGETRIEITSSASMSTQPVLSPWPAAGSATRSDAQPGPQSS